MKISNDIVAEYTETYGKPLTDVLSTGVRDLTKLVFDRTELSTLIGAAQVLETDRPKLVECLKEYIPSQRLKWAREEQKADKNRFGKDEWEERFEVRCPVLFGLLAPEKKKVKRKADATIAYNTGKATDDQKASIAGQLASIEAHTDARNARRDGLATDAQIRLIAPEIARSEAKILARLNELAALEQLERINPSQDFVLSYNGKSFIVDKLVLTQFWMNFVGLRDASKISHKLHCYFHFTKVDPRNLQQLTSNGRKALMPGKRLTDDTIFGNDHLPPNDNPGVHHLQRVDREDLNKELWGHPSMIMCLLFFFRHHGKSYPFVAGQVVHAYCIFKTNPKFNSFAQHKWNNMIANGCELLCKSAADVEPDACIQITIHKDGDAFGATYKLIRNSGNMEDAVDFDIL